MFRSGIENVNQHVSLHSGSVLVGMWNSSSVWPEPMGGEVMHRHTGDSRPGESTWGMGSGSDDPHQARGQLCNRETARRQQRKEVMDAVEHVDRPGAGRGR